MDAWACREGTPEDDEDEQERARAASQPCGENRAGGGSRDPRGGEDGIFSVGIGDARDAPSTDPKDNIVSYDNEMRGPGNSDASHDWVKLDLYPHADEEIGRKGR